jgi:hypothetical protein
LTLLIDGTPAATRVQHAGTVATATATTTTTTGQAAHTMIDAATTTRLTSNPLTVEGT